jgi:hypothetical protein
MLANVKKESREFFLEAVSGLPEKKEMKTRGKSGVL